MPAWGRWCIALWSVSILCFSCIKAVENRIEDVVENVNERPIIGVLAMGITDKLLLKLFPEVKGKKYLAGSYIKLIEMAGARVVPIIPGTHDDVELEVLFKSVNGILFPGGEINLQGSGYHNTSKKLLKMAIEANKNGNFFPILGICRGMQALAVNIVENLSPLILTNSKNFSTTLKWDLNELKDSVFLSSLPKMMINESEEYDITSHFHKYGITPDTLKDTKLLDTFKNIATSLDRDGKEFISVMEGKTLPFLGIQFHPEKPIFEWSEIVTIPHSTRAIRLSQYITNSFVDQVRRNTGHSFDNSKVERKYLIANFERMRTDNVNGHSPFQEIYVF